MNQPLIQSMGIKKDAQLSVILCQIEPPEEVKFFKFPFISQLKNLLESEWEFQTHKQTKNWQDQCFEDILGFGISRLSRSFFEKFGRFFAGIFQLFMRKKISFLGEMEFQNSWSVDRRTSLHSLRPLLLTKTSTTERTFRGWVLFWSVLIEKAKFKIWLKLVLWLKSLLFFGMRRF